VLDPACGSGNFLYLALKALRDIEKRAHVEALELGLPAPLNMETGPHNILGLEINEFAAELARVTVWIGDIQWCRRNGYPHAINPILKPLDGIAHRDALLNPDGSEADWPTADVIVGNPPFLGGSRKSGELGREYFDALNRVYDQYVPGGADLVCYWFHKSRQQIVAGQLRAAGLVATQAIRAGSNRKVLEAILADTRIFEAWSDEEWINEGAAVRVSLLGFGPIFPVDRSNRLNGLEVAAIHADLSAADGLDLTKATPLEENLAASFEGVQKNGPFDIPSSIALDWLGKPNPNGRPNSDVLRPYKNAKDVAARSTEYWLIDFYGLSEAEASLYELPFEYVTTVVKPERATKAEAYLREKYWLLKRPAPDFRRQVTPLSRYIVTPRVAKHRYFVWQSANYLPDSRLNAITSASDITLGLLSSRIHLVWALAKASMHGVGNDPTYNNQSCFQTFPFPPGLTPRDTAPVAGQASPPCLAGQMVAANIAAAARRLNELREAWLNPAEWVDWVITPEEEKAGFPQRPVAKPGHEADLKKRTLTNLYNARPAWLDLAHKALDQAVATAYDWPDYTPAMTDEEILRRLLALNLERAQA
jgi:type II restriction/modification system DNA methylase subunit YeeA